MLFHVSHTHNHETCPAGSPEKVQDFSEFLAQLKGAAGIKVLGGYVSPIAHVFFFLIESDDFGAVTRALGPLNVLGTGDITPIIPLDVAVPMAEEGAFRMP